MQSKVSCCLHMYFLWRHHLPPDKSQNDQDSNSDWFAILLIVWTHDCWHCFLVFNIWVNHALEMIVNFYYPTLKLFCFSFIQPFTHSKFCLPNPFLFGAPFPDCAHSNDCLSFVTIMTEARVKRRTFRAPNLMQMKWNKELSSSTLGSAHEKFDVWPWPELMNLTK